MALCTAAEVIMLAPEFENVSIPKIEFYIARAEEQISEEAWGSRAKLACMYLTCHLMTIAGVAAASSGSSSSATGPVTSVSVGDVSVQYADASTGAVSGGASASLANNKYGLEYSRLIDLAGMGAALAVED